MTAALQRLQVSKQAKIDQLIGQKRNFDIEVSGLEIAQEALKAKIKKRTGQQHESELQVKTIREKLNEIQKRVTPEAIKNLNKLLEKQDVAKLYTMLESFTGLIMNSKSPSPHDIKDAIKTQSHLVE